MNNLNKTEANMLNSNAHMGQAFMKLLTHTPDDNLRWKGTNTDLIEMIHVVYEAELVRDSNGCLASFTSLVRRVFSLMHIKVPANPHAYLNKAHCRKGIRQLPFAQRYAQMLLNNANLQPMETFVERGG